MKTLTFLSLLHAISAVADSTGVPTLINGRPASPQEFPASIWVGMCSATVVGERAVFLAAHCVQTGQKIGFSVGPNRYTATCSRSSDYRANETADYALCKTDRVVTGIAYDRINSDPRRFTKGENILLSGYGCRRAGGSGGIDGVYRIGESKITRLPSGTNNDIVTTGGAALCFGDSGGPAFHVDQKTGDRVVVSTNSRGDIRTTSYLSATHTSQAQRFFQAWYEQTGAKLCGIHQAAPGCRGKGGSDLSTFEITHPIASVTGTMAPGSEDRLEEVKKHLEEALDGLP